MEFNFKRNLRRKLMELKRKLLKLKKCAIC